MNHRIAACVPLLALAWAACATNGGGSGADASADDASDAQIIGDVSFPDVSPDTSLPDAAVCPPPPSIDGGLTATLAPAFQKDYALYDLGPPPGVPDPLGGCTIHWQDDDTLLIAGTSEDTTSALYSIKIQRDACSHVIGWNGTAKLVASAPYMDANLVYLGASADGGTSGLLLYTEWPTATIGQLLPTDTTPSRETDLSTIGLIAQGSLGGLGIVPSGAHAGELRGVTYPVYGGISEWHRIQIATDGQLVKITGVTQTLQLCDGCGAGGFAYVPPGSPDFTSASVLVAEWLASTPSRVSGYDIDANGDPIISTRFDFITNFVSPYGAYFDRVSGDYLFLQWQFTFNQVPDHVVVVRRFNKPPAPPPPPN